MPAYMIVERLEIWDQTFHAEYRRLAAKSMAKYGGRYLTVNRDAILLEGGEKPDLVAILEFPTTKMARDWYDSSDYQTAIKIRNSGSRDRFLLVEARVPGYATSPADVQALSSSVEDIK